MANEKMLNTRIQLKYDSYEKWETSTVILKPGEIAIAYLTTDYAVAPGETDFQHPVLFKVGDNVHTFSELPWASALAADVYEWAKQTENDFVSTFLALKMNDGTTMQTKLDEVFATDQELADAINGLKLELPTISIVDDDEAEIPTTEFVNVYKNLIASGHTLTEELVQIPTKLYVDNKITGAVDYLGTVDSLEALKALNPQNKGDFARVSVGFGDYHASDMLICETLKSEGVDATWSVIHGEIDANDWVANAQGAAGYVAIPVADRVWGADGEGNPSWMKVQAAQIADGVVNNAEITIAPTGGLTLSTGSDGKFTLNQGSAETVGIEIAEKGVTNDHIADKTISAEKTKAYVANAGETSEEVWVFYCGTSDFLVD